MSDSIIAPSHIWHAELELKHVQLELEHRRCQHMRHFIDQYYCYRKGFVKSSGVADWDAPIWKGVVSVAARREEGNRKLVVKEHAVPIKEITNLLLQLNNPSLDDIAKVLKQFTILATITQPEDATLRRLKLTSRMPDGFQEQGHRYFQDVLARYKHAGIMLEDVDLEALLA